MACPGILTLFPFLKHQYLEKDVGALPYYLASRCGWSSAIAYLAECPGDKKQIHDLNYERHVRLISMGCRGGMLSNVFSVLMFLFRQARNFDLLNLYHDSLRHMVYALVYKLFNPKGTVYLKLDIGHLGLKAFQKVSKGIITRQFLRIKEFVSRFAVDMYTVETVAVYEGLADSSYFSGRLFHLPNGTLFDDQRDLSDLWKNKEKIILTVGNLGAYAKNNELLVDAVALLPSDVLEGWKILFVGSYVNSEYYESGFREDDHFKHYLQATIERNPHLADVFICTGPVTDRTELKELYDRSSIFCLTSRYEGFPHVLLEASNSACYLVSTDLPASREMTDDGKNGSLFASEDIDSLSNILCWCISDTVSLEEPALAVHMKSREMYDWRIIAAKLDALYYSLKKGGICG